MDALPPLPFDEFPAPVRLLGRRLLGDLWRSCFTAGYDAGEAVGLLKGIGFASAFFLGLVAVGLVVALVTALVTLHTLRGRRP